jgi:hypothetical protein
VLGRDSGQDRPEVVWGDFPTEAQGLGPTPHPLPRSLTGARVVLLFALGNDAQVVVQSVFFVKDPGRGQSSGEGDRQRITSPTMNCRHADMLETDGTF